MIAAKLKLTMNQIIYFQIVQNHTSYIITSHSKIKINEVESIQKHSQKYLKTLLIKYQMIHSKENFGIITKNLIKN